MSVASPESWHNGRDSNLYGVFPSPRTALNVMETLILWSVLFWWLYITNAGVHYPYIHTFPHQSFPLHFVPILGYIKQHLACLHRSSTVHESDHRYLGTAIADITGICCAYLCSTSPCPLYSPLHTSFSISLDLFSRTRSSNFFTITPRGFLFLNFSFSFVISLPYLLSLLCWSCFYSFLLLISHPTIAYGSFWGGRVVFDR